MLPFGFSWPEALDCSKLPERNDHRDMCIEGKILEDLVKNSIVVFENGMLYVLVVLSGPGESHRPLSLPPSSLNVLQTNPLFYEKFNEILDKDGKSFDKLPENVKNYTKILQLFKDQVKVNKQRPAQVSPTARDMQTTTQKRPFLEALDK